MRAEGHKILLLLGLLILGPAATMEAEAQGERTFGVHVGQARARQVWSGPFETEAIGGLTLGVNVDVSTPIQRFSVRVGVGYVRRGSRFLDPEEAPGSNGAVVRSHYLSVPVHAKLRFGLGPFHAHAFAGPTIDQLLETQCSADVCRVFEEETPTALSVTGGLGLAVDVVGRLRIEGEIGLVEGLSEAYRAQAQGVRYRTVETVLRLAFPF